MPVMFFVLQYYAIAYLGEIIILFSNNNKLFILLWIFMHRKYKLRLWEFWKHSVVLWACRLHSSRGSQVVVARGMVRHQRILCTCELILLLLLLRLGYCDRKLWKQAIYTECFFIPTDMNSIWNYHSFFNYTIDLVISARVLWKYFLWSI